MAPCPLAPFDPGEEPDGIVEKLMLPRATWHQLEPGHGKWLEPRSPVLVACSLSVCPLQECSSSGRHGGGRACRATGVQCIAALATTQCQRAHGSEHTAVSTRQSCATAAPRAGGISSAGSWQGCSSIQRTAGVASGSLHVGCEEMSRRDPCSCPTCTATARLPFPVEPRELILCWRKGLSGPMAPSLGVGGLQHSAFAPACAEVAAG